MSNENRKDPKMLFPDPIIETNKAAIIRLSDDTIMKRYTTTDAAVRAQHDKHSLSYMQTHFGDVCMNGWRYYTPKFFGLDVDGKSYQMEWATGDPLSCLARPQICDAEYQSGIWLALYHDRIIGSSDQGYVFSDFNVHNIMIDFTQEQIAAIDPGVSWGQSGFSEEDVVHHVHSLLTVLIFNGRAPLRALFKFLDGYLETRERPFGIRSYYQAFVSDYRRKFRRFRRKTVAERLKFYGSFVVLLPIQLLVVPSYARLVK